VKISINYSPKIKRVSVKKNPPIVLSDKSLNAYLYPEKPVLLHFNGDISCGDKIFKNRPRARHFRVYYGNMFDYLKKKKILLNVSGFRKKDLGDVVEEMQSNKKRLISLRRLIEIYSYENQIAEMRRIAIERLKKIAYKRWWKEYRRLLDLALLNSDHKQAEKFRRQLDEKQKVVSEIINFRR